MTESIHDAEALRAWVEKSLRRPLPDTAWEFEVTHRYVEEVLDGTEEREDYLDGLRERLRAYGGWSGPAPRKRIEGDPDELPRRSQSEHRAVALSAWAFKAASAEPRVRRFRRHRLHGRLLDPTEVDEWLTRWRSEARVPGKGIDLEWAVPLEDTVWTIRKATVRRDGRLAALAELSDRLANRYRWRPGEATTFILTGERPLVFSLASRISLRMGGGEPIGDYDAFSWVQLRLDPTISPEELAEWWREMRRELFGGRRHRPMNERHFALAGWMAERTAETSWEEDRRAWNREYPEWAYSQRSNFQRDATTATRDLLLLELKPPGSQTGSQTSRETG